MHKVLFKIGNFEVLSYSFFWAIALSVWVLYYGHRAIKVYKRDPKLFSNASFFALVGAFIGAKIGGYFEYWSYYMHHPDRIWRIWESGMSSGPAILGASLLTIWYLKKHGENIWIWGEAVSKPCALMLAIGRIGCFLNGCCYGVITSNKLLGVKFPDVDGLRYPTQLFYVFFNFFIFVLLCFIEKRYPYKRLERPVLFPTFLVSYGLMRFFVDFLRDGDRLFGLRVAQWTSFVAIGVGLWAFYKASLKERTTVQG